MFLLKKKSYFLVVKFSVFLNRHVFVMDLLHSNERTKTFNFIYSYFSLTTHSSCLLKRPFERMYSLQISVIRIDVSFMLYRILFK